MEELSNALDKIAAARMKLDRSNEQLLNAKIEYEQAIEQLRAVAEKVVKECNTK